MQDITARFLEMRSCVCEECKMMKLKYLFDNRELAKMLLSNWKYDEASLKMLDYFRISSNAVYPFQYEGKTRFLRFAPVSEKDKSNIIAELEFINYLNSNDYPALRTVLSNSSEELITADTPWGEYYAAVFDRVAGTQMGDIELNETILFQYGKALGKLHKLSSMYVPANRRWSYEDVLLWMSNILSEHQGHESAQRELELLQKYFSKIPKTKNTYGLVHYDFELDNVFYDETASTCSVIDFDDAMYHWYVMDIEQALDSIKEALVPTSYAQARETFLNGYKSEYPIDDELLSLMPAFRRFANLYSYTRILRASAEKLDNEPKWLSDLRIKLANAMKNKSAGFGDYL